MSHTPIGVIVIVVLALGAVGLQNHYDQSAGYSYSNPGKQHQAAQKASPDANATIDTPVSPPAADEIASKHYSDPDCPSGNITECDLAAQQSMAESTREMYYAAWVAVALTGVGIFLIWRTLHHTAKAAQFASDTLKEAEAATVAANETVAVTKDTAVRQLRAYVVGSGATIEFTPDRHALVLSANIKNTGLTPALNLRMMGESFSAPFPFQEDRPHPEPTEKFGTPVGAGDEIQCINRLSGINLPAALDAVHAGTHGMWIHGTVKYTDIYGHIHTTRFRYVYGGRVARVGMTMYADETGNEAD